MQRIPVTFFQRKPLPGNFSLEFIFADVRKRLEDQIDATVNIAPYFSKGLFRRLGICLNTWRRQNRVNHITGDINFAGILIKPSHTIQTILDCGTVDRNVGIKKSILRLFWIRLPVHRARFVTTISEHAKNQILSHVNCDPDKIHVIYVAVSQNFVPQPQPFNQDNPRILQVGTKQNKNINRLAEAIRDLPCTLAIVGNINDELRSVLEINNIEVDELGRLDDEEMVNEYAKADLIAFASTYEGFGMPIVEGNCVGRPVLTSNVASMPEVAGDAACLVDPFSVESIRGGILRIIEDKRYRESLIEKGFENAKRFHPDEIANQYFQLYERIATNN